MQIDIDIASQRLRLLSTRHTVEQVFSVSTSEQGLGERYGSGQTPRGHHRVCAMIGHHQPLYTVFVGRRPTGERYNAQLEKADPHRDWILTRILWLSGCEVGRNRLGNVDTMRRYIYIHGTPEKNPMGIPLSKGCIRMHNHDVVALFDAIQPGCPVYIY